MYYSCSENKEEADQLRIYCEADLQLCIYCKADLCLGKNPVFSWHGSYFKCIESFQTFDFENNDGSKIAKLKSHSIDNP